MILRLDLVIGGICEKLFSLSKNETIQSLSNQFLLDSDAQHVTSHHTSVPVTLVTSNSPSQSITHSS